MSTFPGPITEIGGVSVDRFDGENKLASVYFLSHCHTDHMEGLSRNFFEDLKTTDRRLYCSAFTKQYLAGKNNLNESLVDCIRVTATCSPIIVDYKYNNEDKTLTVNAIPAGHSPGSVMFILENSNFRILCTGDFRLSPSDLPKLKPLNNFVGSRAIPKKFHKIYLDTTFLNKDYPEFPTREKSCEEICKIAKKWLCRDKDNVVSLECSGYYGTEYLYTEVMGKLGLPVHVRSFVYDDYCNIDDLRRCVTVDSKITPVHACAARNSQQLECRPEVDAKNILTIVPSALRWKNRDVTSAIGKWDETKKNRYYVCTATHASYNELRAFVEYFKPNDIFPCVDPPAYTKTPAVNFLREILENMAIGDAPTNVQHDLGSLLAKSTKQSSNYFSDDSD